MSGALARAAENAVRERPELVPVRWTVDLYSPARMEPSSAAATIVRESRRLCLVDAVFSQGGKAASRASGLFVRPSENSAGKVWTHAPHIEPPRTEDSFDSDRLYWSGATWSPDAAEHLNAERKVIWHFPVPIVDGEELTLFQFVASVADVSSLATNFGTDGLEYINPDFTLAMTRLPADFEVGVAATSRIEQSGITLGTAAIFDRCGTFGTVMVSGIANPQRAVRFPVPAEPAAD